MSETAASTGRTFATIETAGQFDLALSLRGRASFLPPAGPPATMLRAGVYVGGQPAVIEIRQCGALLTAEGPAELEQAKLRDIAARLVDADLDLRPFYAAAEAHPAMCAVTSALVGLKPLRPAALFEMLVVAVTEQQLSLAAAFHIRQRLVERFGARIDGIWLFPTPESLATAPLPLLKACGLSAQKAGYITALARAIAERRLDLAALESMGEAEARAVLAQHRGFGEWSIDYVLARGLGHHDSLPAGDVGLRRVVGRYLGGGLRLSPEELRRALAPFAPYRSLAAYYFAVHARLFPEGLPR